MLYQAVKAHVQPLNSSTQLPQEHILIGAGFDDVVELSREGNLSCVSVACPFSAKTLAEFVEAAHSFTDLPPFESGRISSSSSIESKVERAISKHFSRKWSFSQEAADNCAQSFASAVRAAFSAGLVMDHCEIGISKQLPRRDSAEVVLHTDNTAYHAITTLAGLTTKWTLRENVDWSSADASRAIYRPVDLSAVRSLDLGAIAFFKGSRVSSETAFIHGAPVPHSDRIFGDISLR
ncbi:MAG: DUF1826 domain-containing protein [Deltaproteobacteria bacterium]|nr:DUF1826 domain-containing protein [Deltaproteobacteria bacterium]